MAETKTILIVDDIPDYLNSVEVYLEDRFTVLKADSMENAKSLFLGARVHLAIIDIRLKEDDPENRDGLLFLEWIKQQTPDMPVIVMSAYREFDYAVEALNAGADYFMRKPLEPDELMATVKKLV